MENQTYDGKCKVTELVAIYYKIDFREGKTFLETLPRVCREGRTYADELADCYNAYTGAATTRYNVTIVSIHNGWR